MSTEATGNGSRTSSSSTAQWSDLPDDLLSMVYLRLMTAASPLDRVYFAAVSRSWRSVAARHPAPPHLLPWLVFSPHRGDYNSRTRRAFRADDGAVLPVRLPSKATGKRFVGSHDGGWVALDSFDGLSVIAVNIFSGAETTLPVRRRRKLACTRHPGLFVIAKAVFSEAPTSSHCVMAAITDTCSVVLSTVNGSTTQLACAGYRLTDISWCNNGDLLYGLLSNYDAALVKFEIAVNNAGVPTVTHTSRLAFRGDEVLSRRLSGDLTTRERYIVELRGKLLLVIRNRWPIRPDIYFKVYELAHVDDGMYKWTEITSLGDYALFVGSSMQQQCMAARVPPATTRDGAGAGAKGDHIYYCKKMVDGDIPDDDTAYLAASDGHGCRLYCSKDRIGPHPLAKHYPLLGDLFRQVDRIESIGYHVPGEATWIIPPNI